MTFLWDLRRSRSPSVSVGSRSSAALRRNGNAPGKRLSREHDRIIETYKATIAFTAPTAYRVMLSAMDQGPACRRCDRGVGRRDPTGAGVQRLDAKRPAS